MKNIISKTDIKDMIGTNVFNYCCEDISLIENYEKAVNDKTQTWVCHHRLEIKDGHNNYSRKELKEMGLYFDRPAKELIFLTDKQHKILHNSNGNNPLYGTKATITTRKKMSISHMGEKNHMFGVNVYDRKTDDEIKEIKRKISNSLKGTKKPKRKFLTPTGDIVYQTLNTAKRFHPDWKLIE